MRKEKPMDREAQRKMRELLRHRKEFFEIFKDKELNDEEWAKAFSEMMERQAKEDEEGEEEE